MHKLWNRDEDQKSIHRRCPLGTDYNAEREKEKLIHLKYYIRGRWLIEKRKKYLGPITGKERRKAA